MFTIYPYSTFLLFCENSNIPPLTGCTCIYPDSIQDALIDILRDHENNLLKFCFVVNDVYLYPTYTYDSRQIEYPFLFVSDEFFEKYFTTQSEHDIHFVYNIPLVKGLTMKQVSGEFPKGESVEDLLTTVLESSILIQKDQPVVLSFGDNDLLFTIDQIIYKENEKYSKESSFHPHIDDRLKEFELRNRFLDQLPQFFTIENLSLNHFDWYFFKIKDRVAMMGLVANQEVEIEFTYTYTEKIEIPKPQPVIKPQEKDNDNDVIPKGNVLSDVSTENLSREEMRLKRLSYFNK
jgi:hypothetical protein